MGCGGLAPPRQLPRNSGERVSWALRGWHRRIGCPLESRQCNGQRAVHG